MADYSTRTIIAVMDNLGELHEIDYEALANQPTAIKNPYSITIFGQSYDGSNAVTITPSVASASTLGCVKPVAKTSAMTQSVGVDSSGLLYTAGVTIDTNITSFGTAAVSGSAVYSFVIAQTSSVTSYVDQVKEQADEEQQAIHDELQANIDANTKNITTLTTNLSTTNTNLSTLQSTVSSNYTTLNNKIDSTKTTIESEITSVQSSVSTNTSNISSLQSGQSSLSNSISTLDSEVSELQNRVTGYFFSSESALLTWINSNKSSLRNGDELYVTDDMTLFYVWNGSSAIKYTMPESVEGGFMTKINPHGTGCFIMNDCSVGQYGIVTGLNSNQRAITGAAIGNTVTSSTQDGSVAFGRYNVTPDEDNMFLIGAGSDSKNLKTIMSVDVNGNQKLYEDVIAYSDLNSEFIADEALSTLTVDWDSKPDNIVVSVDYNTLLSYVTTNTDNKYVFTYNGSYWTSDSYDFSQTSGGVTYHSPITSIGFELSTNDGTEVGSYSLASGDAFTVQIMQQDPISLRALYNQVNGIGLYVDDEGDVCQYD